VSDTGFPEVSWGSAQGFLAKAGRALVATRPGSWLLRRAVPLDRRLLTRSKGRYTLLGPFGSPLLLLTSTGAKSGKARTTPLLYLLEGDALLLAASNFGGPHHPAWSENLLAHPEAVVSIAGVRYEVTATLLEGEDCRAAWERFEEAARPYHRYGERTDRTIRVFSLRRRQERR
jgi:deazaflavin-dependent oxidoreductase (nitroreductase family)